MAVRFCLPTFFAVVLIQSGCPHTSEPAPKGPIGFLAPAGKSVVSRVDYDVEVQGKTVDCYFLSTPGTRVEVPGKRATPQGWQGEASNVRILDGSFSGERGYLLSTLIKAEQTIHYDSELVAKTTGVSPCPIGTYVNEAKVQALVKDLFRPAPNRYPRAGSPADSDRTAGAGK